MEALKAGAVTKPVVAWVSGTCATLFKSEVQFGHAGAKSGGALESAQVHRLSALDGKLEAISISQAGNRCQRRLPVRERQPKDDMREEQPTHRRILTRSRSLQAAGECWHPCKALACSWRVACGAAQASQALTRLRFAPQAKNAALKEAGAVVPESFEGLESTVGRVYQQLVADGVIEPRPEPTPPSVPQDLSAAKKAGKVRPAGC